jgi:hypothetical protein
LVVQIKAEALELTSSRSVVHGDRHDAFTCEHLHIDQVPFRPWLICAQGGVPRRWPFAKDGARNNFWCQESFTFGKTLPTKVFPGSTSAPT